MENCWSEVRRVVLIDAHTTTEQTTVESTEGRKSKQATEGVALVENIMAS